MNRREFLRLIGLGGAAIVAAPVLARAPVDVTTTVEKYARLYEATEVAPKEQISGLIHVDVLEWERYHGDLMAVARANMERQMCAHVPASHRHRVEWFFLEPNRRDKGDPLGQSGLVGWKYTPA